MPFKSRSQARKLFATNPTLAREFASKTLSIKKLPEKVKRKKSVIHRR
jgi:hypothetical protein